MAKTVLISGGTQGIGRAACIQLLNEGFSVATFSRDKDKCELLDKELKQIASNYLVLQGDVTQEDDTRKVVEEVIQKFKKIDILINNAGRGYFAECDDVDLNRFQDMIQTNIFGLALLTKLVVLYMKKQKSGLIINLASISGKKAFARGEFYSATKFGVMGYSEGIRNELKDSNIKVCTLCPGMIKTDFFDEKELNRRKKLNNGKLSRMLEVEDITRIISLVCNQSEYCDIQDLTVMPF